MSEHQVSVAAVVRRPNPSGSCQSDPAISVARSNNCFCPTCSAAYPIVDEIPRFTVDQHLASFGRQWNKYEVAHDDEDRATFQAKTGMSLSDLKGLRVLDAGESDAEWRFSVTGSKTGPDGEGRSGERFQSKSGRVVIEPGEWGVQRAYRLRRQLTPVGFEVRWQVLPMFADVYRAPRIADPSKEYAVTLAQGLSNGKHTLELITADKTNPPLRAIRVYRPPLR